MALPHAAAQRDHGSVRLRLRVRGAVQGVGFRPFAYGLATRLELSGFVRNGPDGVVVEIEGVRAGEFLDSLRGSPPPLARMRTPPQAESAHRPPAAPAVVSRRTLFSFAGRPLSSECSS
jgi:acylphosphatase